MLKVIKILIVTTCITVSVAAEEKEFIAGQHRPLPSQSWKYPQLQTGVRVCDNQLYQGSQNI